MAAHRARSRAGPADVAAEQEEVHHLLDRGDRVLVLREPHRPARDDSLATHGDLRGLADLLPRQSATREDVVPTRRAQVLDERLEAAGVLANELAVEHLSRPLFLVAEHLLHDAAHHRHVAIDAHRQPEIGERHAFIQQQLHRIGQHVVVFLRIRIHHAHQARLRQRIDRDDFRAVVLRALETRQHPRMIRPRVLTEDENAVALLKVLQCHAPLPDADRFVERRAARFVAHIRAVGHIVRPELPDEKLIEERRFIARPSTCVKGRRIRRWQGVQFVREKLESLLPPDRPVMRRSLALHHRMHQPALLLQPVIALLAQLVDRVRAEEFRRRVLL